LKRNAAFTLVEPRKPIKHFDETPGTYDGDGNDSSDFSHLRKGDKFERTMHISTLTVR
jgi:hypothetical protein